MMVLIAIGAMAFASLAVHLGLFKAILNVANKIASCNTCASFWFCLLVLLYCDCHPLIAPVVSIFMAYLSNWFMLALIRLQTLYEQLWQRLLNK